MRVLYVLTLLTTATRSRIGRPRKRPLSPHVATSHATTATEGPKVEKEHDCCSRTLKADYAVPNMFVQGSPPTSNSFASTLSPEPRFSSREGTSVSNSCEEDLLVDPGYQASLSDLSLAAFVESLYTFEIAPSDGLTPNALLGASSHSPPFLDLGQAMPTADKDSIAPLPFQDIISASDQYTESAFLQDNVTFSVPSDLRWWNAALSLPLSDYTEPEFKVSEEKPNHPSFSSAAQGPSHMHSGKPSMDTSLPSTSNACCANKMMSHLSHANTSCCNGKNTAEGDNALSTNSLPAVLGQSLLRTPMSHPDKVHCVPNPSGTQCSCQCDYSLALLSLERKLRTKLMNSPNDGDASSSLVFTLSMSQAVSNNCACSADCPTCKSSPSYRSSAGLLISTALQIYARALQILQEVLLSDNSSSCKCDAKGCKDCGCSYKHKHSRDAVHQKSFVDVRIGDYVPSAQNSRKIALYAMRLELLDLERALARVQSASQQPLPPAIAMKDFPNTNACLPLDKSSETATTNLCKHLNPFDQLVIKKLHSQLNEVLHAVEGMEINGPVE